VAAPTARRGPSSTGRPHRDPLDNIGDAAQSRAERYAIDERTRTARLLQSYGTPGVTTQIGGSVQSLPGGRTLVSFGTAGRVEEYDAAGNVVWRIERNAGYVFRAQRIRSLYTPGAGLTR
jgi:arylsulfotransferase ASST